MSKVVRGIRKVFKKVVKVVKKVAPIILAAAAIYFTAGAAMGMLPAGATAGSAAAGSLGLSGTLGGVVSGAVIGGAMSKAGGGSFSEGASKGALAGALTGGITGGMNPAGAGVQPTGGVQAPTPSGVDPSTVNAADEAAAMGGNFSHETGMAAVNTGTSPPVGGGVTPPPAKGLMNQGGWLERNQALAGNVISGLGQGLMARGAGDAEIAAMREKQKIINENYAGVKPGAGFTPIAAVTGGQRPNERFNPDSYSSYEYQYNPQSGRIERVNLGA